MFRLIVQTEPFWIDLPQGVRLKLRPLDSIVVMAARNHASREMQAAAVERQDRIEAGVPSDDLPNFDDQALQDALSRVAFARALARYGAMDWGGVASNEAGDPLPFSNDGAEALVAHPDMIDMFLVRYFATVDAVNAEGNASAPMPDGPTGLGATTAADVPPPVPSVPESAAVH